MFDTQTTFSPTVSAVEALKTFKQMRNYADDNVLAGLGLNYIQKINMYLRKDGSTAFERPHTLSTVHFILVCQALFGDN